MLMCKICIVRRLVVDIFPWCNTNFVPFPSGTLVARRMRNGRIIYKWFYQLQVFYEETAISKKSIICQFLLHFGVSISPLFPGK